MRYCSLSSSQKHTGDTRVSSTVMNQMEFFRGEKKLLSVSKSIILALNIYEDHVASRNDLASIDGGASYELEN